MNCNIQAYIDLVKAGTVAVCKQQIQLIERVGYIFATEELFVDEVQLDKYLDLQKYFPYRLLDWERFCFALHNCVYRTDGQLRWSRLVIMVGRGAGKNGYLAFENMALLTPINGVKNYDIDMFATSEQQARATFDDVYNILEEHRVKMQRHFKWTKECITNTKTNSRLRYHTSAPKTKDGGRPGKVDHDEYHAYDTRKLIDVTVSGLGKKNHPRRTIITTNGDVRDGPLDEVLSEADEVLSDKTISDNGTLYFICQLDSNAEIEDKSTWVKANPSYPHFPTLRHEMDIEFADYLRNKVGNSSFATKRLNRPQGDKAAEVTSWDNILATNRPLPDLTGQPCVWGIDYASTQDFVSVGLLFKQGNKIMWVTHSWACTRSAHYSEIHAPLKQWQTMTHLTLVDAPEIDPELPVLWLVEQQKKYHLVHGAIDHYRYTILSRCLTKYGFNTDRKEGNVKLTYLPEQSMIAPLLSQDFLHHHVTWGDLPIMRWYTNNAKQCVDGKGNITYGKIEPKTRKTDGFMAFVAAYTIAEKLDAYTSYAGGLPDVCIY